MELNPFCLTERCFLSFPFFPILSYSFLFKEAQLVNVSAKQKAAIEQAAEGVLAARKQFPNSSLADLYDPISMPSELTKAHQTLDKAVDAAYGKKSFPSEADRVAFLFEEYQKLIAPLLETEKKKKIPKQKIV